HGHLDWLSKQLFADTSEAEFLLRQASMYGITPTPATFAAGNVTATGTNGSVIPINSVLQLEGLTYHATASATIASGTATVPIQADVAGAASNTAAGVTMAFQAPISGVNATVTVAGPNGITGGEDEESIEEVRDRLLLRLREPPEGGANQDYIA